MKKERISIKGIRSIKGAAAVEKAAASIWTEHYSPIIGQEQVRYMLDKYQTAERILDDIRAGGYKYYAAFSGSTCVGYCAFKVNRESGSVFLSKCYVDRDFRRKGLARRFVEKAVLAAEINGCGHIWLTVNRKNISSIEAYAKLGFRVTDVKISDIGGGFVMDDYIMAKNMIRR